MILHWLTSAWRSLIANPLFSLITVISLAIGCCGALLAGSSLKQHLTFEHWLPDADRIAVVTLTSGSQMISTGPSNFRSSSKFEGPSVRRPSTSVVRPMRNAIDGKIPGMEMQARLVRGQPLLLEDKQLADQRQAAGPLPPGELAPAFTGTAYVDPEFFKMFQLPFVEGSAAAINEPDRIILTQSRAKRLFGNKHAVGQTVEGVPGHSLQVIGVLRDLPVATHLAFESVAGMRTYELMRSAAQAGGPGGAPPPGIPEWFEQTGGSHYLLRTAGIDEKTFITTANQVIKREAEIGIKTPPPSAAGRAVFITSTTEYGALPLLDMHFALVGPSSGDPILLTTLAVAAFALLAVSAFNYVTLSLARSLRRRREVSIRKVLGASQGSLVRQYLVESGVVTAIALVIGFALTAVLHPWFARLIGQPDELFDLFDPVFLAFALAGFVVLAAVVGAYPAFYLAHVRPQSGLGEGGAAAPGRISRAVTTTLLGAQIAAATTLLVIAMTMMAQANYIQTAPVGFDVKNKYLVSFNCFIGDRVASGDMSAMIRRCNTGGREIISKETGIYKIAYYGGGQFMSEFITTNGFGKTKDGPETARSSQVGVDTDFLQTMGAKLIAGRFFDSKSAYDRALIDRIAMQQAMGPPQPGAQPPPPLPKIEKVPVVVTRAWVPLLGVDSPEKAIGQQFVSQPNSTYPYEVVGVVEDWHQRPLKYAINPVLFIPQSQSSAIIEIDKANAPALRERLTTAWRQMLGNERAMVNMNSLEDIRDRAYQTDYRLMRAVTTFALVAIAVAALGVFGLSTFEMRRRVREIGIRKALGASPFMVAGMIVGRALLFAVGVSVLAWPFAYWIASGWLASFVYRTSLGIVVMPLATLGVGAFVALAVGLSSGSAAAMRPHKALAVA